MKGQTPEALLMLTKAEKFEPNKIIYKVTKNAKIYSSNTIEAN